MTSIEVQTLTENKEYIPVNARKIHLDALVESTKNGQILTQPLEEVLRHRHSAAWHEKMANEPTTDEMRLELFGTPLPEGHVAAPTARKIGASALR